MLIALSGLPGVGKTSIACALARALGAVHVCVDSIEHAIGESETTSASLEEAGYRVGYAVARDNLQLGRIVIADSVNPLPVTRDAWLDVAQQANVPFNEVEIICSDAGEHFRRVEQRHSAGMGPSWLDVVGRGYRPWQRERLVLDTASLTVDHAVAFIRAAILP